MTEAKRAVSLIEMMLHHPGGKYVKPRVELDLHPQV